MAETKSRRSAAVAKQDKELTELEKIKACVERIATLSGHGNVLKEYGLERWEPSKNDMRKYKQ